MRACLSEGFLTHPLNPKVVRFYLAVVTQFVPEDGSVVATSLPLGGVHAAIGILWPGFVAPAAGRARVRFERLRVAAWLDRLVGMMLLAPGLRVAMGD